jgi:WD40 repeat protein
MSRSLRVRQVYINTVKLAVRRSGFPSQRALSEDVGLSLATVSNFLTGKPVDRATFVELCNTLSLDSGEIADLGPEPDPLPGQSLSQPYNPDGTEESISPGASPPRLENRDWGEAMDVSVFYGREEELSTLSQWIVEDCCRLISLLGMGGIGKSALSVKLAEQIQNEFEFVIWRTLRNAPPLEELLIDLLGVLSCQHEKDLPEAPSSRITLLVKYLQSSRCFLVLDNVESILCTGDRAGAYRQGYEIYGEFFQTVGESRHQSCLMLTSREMPGGLAAKASKVSPIRSFRLSGLDPNNARAILEDKGFAFQSTNHQILVDRYSGNPLALKIAATTIQDLFENDLALFLEQGTTVFGDIADLLEQQFNRLTGFEQQIMYWLAIAREWVSLPDLREDILPPAAPKLLLESLESLQQRSLIEKKPSIIAGKPALFTQQPVVMEYVIDRLIDQVCKELMDGGFATIDHYALNKAQTKEYLRHTQLRLIIQPILTQLQRELGSPTAIQACLDQVLAALKARPFHPPGYAAGNLINLLNGLGISLKGYDFSQLPIWQVYLQGMNLSQVDFAYADLTKAVFTQTMGDILSITFSPVGEFIATGIDRQILLWHLTDRRQIASLEGHTGWVRCLAFSPDGQLLASGSTDHTIRLWNLKTGQCLKTLYGHSGGIQSLAFSPASTTSSENSHQLLASGSTDQTIRLWDVQTLQCIKTLSISAVDTSATKIHEPQAASGGNRILSVIFSPDGQTLISTADDQTIRFWDIASDKCRKTLETHVNWILSTALSPDGTTLVTGSDHQTVKFWEAQTGECLGTLPEYNATVWSVAFSPDGQLLATGSDDKTIRLWDVQTRQCLKTWRDHGHQVWQVSFSPDGRTLVSGGEDQAVRVWDVASGHCLTTVKSHRNWVATIAFSPDDSTLVSGSKDQQIRLWDVETGLCTKTQAGHSDVVTALAFDASAFRSHRLLASGSDDHTIKLWEAQTLECVKTLHGHQGWVAAIAFSPDGKTLISGSSDKTLKLWDVTSGECLQTLSEHTQRVKSVAFHPQGDWVASGSDDHTIKIWDISTGNCSQTLEGHSDWVLSVRFSPDGKLLASGSGDRTLKIWDWQTGKCLQTLAGHSHRVRSVAFGSVPGGKVSKLSGPLNSPDLEDFATPASTQIRETGGLWLASGSEDCTVKLWNPSTGDCLHTLQGHDQVVWTVTFSHEGDTIASCSDDGTIQIWDTVTGENLKVLQAERPYEGMNITGAVGLTPAQKATLCALGAIAE